MSVPKNQQWDFDEVDPKGEGEPYCFVADSSGKVLFDSLNSEVAEIVTEHDDEGGRHRWDKAGRKHLRLAAAAPELLAAAKLILAYDDAYMENDAVSYPDFLPEMRALLTVAIAKAEGGAS